MRRIGTIGTGLDIHDDGSHLAHAAELEELGYGALWISGGQLDRLDRITEVLAATRRIAVVPSIIPTGAYDDGEVAALYRRAGRERFLAGLGAPQQPRAMTALGSYLDRLDAAIPPPDRLLAALGPRKLELARDRFAGAITLLVTPEYVRRARAVLGPDRTLVVEQPVVLDDDPDRARETARGLLDYLLGVRGYADNFRRMGFSDDDIATTADHLVDAVVVRGGPDQVAERVAALRAAGADHVSVGGLGGPGSAGSMETARILAGPLLG